MWRRFWGLAIPALIIIILVILQFSFISPLPGIFGQANLILIALVFALFFLSLRGALISALAAGLLFDVLSFDVFGLHALILTLVILAAYWLMENWLTNKSFYSFVLLSAVSTFAYDLLFWIASVLSGNGGGSFIFSGRFWKLLAYQEAWAVAAALVLFNLAAAVSKRVRPFFLDKKKFS